MSNPLKDWTMAEVEAHNQRLQQKAMHANEQAEKVYRQKTGPQQEQWPTRGMIERRRKMAEIYDNKNQSQSPELERPARNEPVAEKAREDGHPGRIRVSVESRRTRLLDPDNLCPKYFIDCLRYAEFIPDDRAQDIELIVSQTKVKSKAEEETVIVISMRLEAEREFRRGG